ncbi:MAG TPA: chemotaxis protein CheC [Opitutaceae bacterium]|jgi:chemotaxis protein CheC|nr:chemotaxis protein CheC [Opitutaceae bacterium]
MELTVDQKDGITELINIGYGRAAGALSELTGYRIFLEVPQVAIHDIEALAPMLDNVLGRSIASVNQAFTGPVNGNALMLMDEPSAVILSRLLGDDHSLSRTMDSNAKETITEVGNILLNACLGVFGNLLRIHVNFEVPQMHLDSADHLIESAVLFSEEKLSHGLMIHTRFRVKAENLIGYLVIVLGITSLDRLLLELGNWETRQAQ